MSGCGPRGRVGLPLEGQRQHREHGGHSRGDDRDQDRVRADVHTADASQHAVNQGKESDAHLPAKPPGGQPSQFTGRLQVQGGQVGFLEGGDRAFVGEVVQVAGRHGG